MAEAEITSQSDFEVRIEDERYYLRDGLVVLQGDMKHKFDYTGFIKPLLTDKALATKRLIARLKRQVEPAQLGDLSEGTTPSPAPPPPAIFTFENVLAILEQHVLQHMKALDGHSGARAYICCFRKCIRDTISGVEKL